MSLSSGHQNLSITYRSYVSFTTMQSTRAGLSGPKPTTSTCKFESFPQYWPRAIVRNREDLYSSFNENQISDIKSWVQAQEVNPGDEIHDKTWAAYFGCCQTTWYRLMNDRFLPPSSQRRKRRSFGFGAFARTKLEDSDLPGDQAPMNAES